MGSEEQKERARIKRRNMVAKDMLNNKRQFGERRIKDQTKEKVRANNQKLIKDYYTNDEANEEDCIRVDACTWPDCGCYSS